jgi:hypothetical protein
MCERLTPTLQPRRSRSSVTITHEQDAPKEEKIEFTTPNGASIWNMDLVTRFLFIGFEPWHRSIKEKLV